jgi:hypothetical protein
MFTQYTNQLLSIILCSSTADIPSWRVSWEIENSSIQTLFSKTKITCYCKNDIINMKNPRKTLDFFGKRLNFFGKNSFFLGKNWIFWKKFGKNRIFDCTIHFFQVFTPSENLQNEHNCIINNL